MHHGVWTFGWEKYSNPRPNGSPYNDTITIVTSARPFGVEFIRVPGSPRVALRFTLGFLRPMPLAWVSPPMGDTATFSIPTILLRLHGFPPPKGGYGDPTYKGGTLGPGCKPWVQNPKTNHHAPTGADGPPPRVDLGGSIPDVTFVVLNGVFLQKPPVLFLE